MSSTREHTNEVIRILDKLHGTDCELTLAVSFGKETKAVATSGRELHLAFGAILRRFKEISPVRSLRIALLVGHDTDGALAALRSASTDESFTAYATTPELLELLINFIEAVTGDRHSDEPLPSTVRLRHSAQWLIRLCAKALPATHRSRYLAEFTADMADLGRGDQLKYALHVLSRILPLRQALKSRGRHIPARIR